METLETDVLIVGAGAAGLYAAAQAAAVGLGVVVVEASELLGGSTAADTGQLWLPGTEHGAKFGGPDRPADIRAHLDAILGAPSAASSAARRDAFAETSAAVGAWLDAHQVGLGVVRGKPDFHPEAPQARRSGRVVAAAPFDKVYGTHPAAVEALEAAQGRIEKLLSIKGDRSEYLVGIA